jgi:hypothetical protein
MVVPAKADGTLSVTCTHGAALAVWEGRVAKATVPEAALPSSSCSHTAAFAPADSSFAVHATCCKAGAAGSLDPPGRAASAVTSMPISSPMMVLQAESPGAVDAGASGHRVAPGHSRSVSERELIASRAFSVDFSGLAAVRSSSSVAVVAAPAALVAVAGLPSVAALGASASLPAGPGSAVVEADSAAAGSVSVGARDASAASASAIARSAPSGTSSRLALDVAAVGLSRPAAARISAHFRLCRRLAFLMARAESFGEISRASHSASSASVAGKSVPATGGVVAAGDAAEADLWPAPGLGLALRAPPLWALSVGSACASSARLAAAVGESEVPSGFTCSYEGNSSTLSVSKTFSGLRSVWITPQWECRNAIARVMRLVRARTVCNPMPRYRVALISFNKLSPSSSNTMHVSANREKTRPTKS